MSNAANQIDFPNIILRGGFSIPQIGLGTFGSDHYDAQTVAAAVHTGLIMGYRLIDCASVYGNEAQIGEVLKKARQGGIDRQDIFITSKVWNDQHGPGDVLLACAQSLKNLQLDYLDLYFIHWPFRNYHPKNAPPDYHHPDARPYQHDLYMETWYQMERLQLAGYVRQIGVSNMTLTKMKLLLRDCTIMPAAIEMELHPTFQQPALFDFCKAMEFNQSDIARWAPPSRPDRDRFPGDVVDMEEPAIKRIAKDHGITPAQVCLKWAAQRGQIPIPFSVKPDQLKSNLGAVRDRLLTQQDMLDIAALDQNCRLVKGQVFLWDQAKDWTDLWDLDDA